MFSITLSLCNTFLVFKYIFPYTFDENKRCTSVFSSMFPLTIVLKLHFDSLPLHTIMTSTLTHELTKPLNDQSPLLHLLLLVYSLNRFSF